MGSDLARLKAHLSVQVTFVLLFASFPFIWIFLYLDQPILSLSLAIIDCLFLGCWALSKKGQYWASSLGTMGIANMATLIYSLALGVSTGIHILFLPMTILPLIIFHKRSVLARILFLILPILGYYCVMLFKHSSQLDIQLKPFEMALIHLGASIAAFGILIAVLRFVFLQHDTSENQLRESNRSLQQAYCELKETNIQLIGAKEIAELSRAEKEEALAQQLTLNIQLKAESTVRQEFYEKLQEKSIEIESRKREAETLAADLQHSYTELKDTHEQLKESIHTIEGMSHKAMLGGILQGIAHELNTPLTNIYSVSDRVLMKKDIDDQTATYMHDIFRCVERATSLMRLMLKDTTSVTNENKDIDVPEMITQIKHLVRDQAFRDKIQLEVLVADNLPAIKGTEVYVFQALLNLVVNALNHTKAGGKLTIEARDNPDTNHVQISITDTGEGIPEDILPHIFESGVSSKKGVLSAGLGLVFVKRVLDAHHATIHVSSTVGEGSCFTVAFPTLTSV